MEDCSDTSSSMFLEHAASKSLERKRSEFNFCFFLSLFSAVDYFAFLPGVLRSHPRDSDLGTIRSTVSLSMSLPPNSFVLKLSSSAVYALRTWLYRLSFVSSSIESAHRQSGSWGYPISQPLISYRLPLLSYDSRCYKFWLWGLSESFGLWYFR